MKYKRSVFTLLQWLLMLVQIVNCHHLSLAVNSSDNAYTKSYASSDEEVFRHRTWSRNVTRDDASNELQSYNKHVNEWRPIDQDVTSVDEMKPFNSALIRDTENQSRLTLPREIDYCELEYVSTVDRQQGCNSCWAFAVVGSIEGLMKKTKGEMVKLSSQQLLDCTAEDSNCQSGPGVDAMRSARDYGLQPASCYPYEAEKKECRYNPDDVVFNFRSFEVKCDLSEHELETYLVNVGPIATMIVTMQSFHDYRVGIYSTDECTAETEVDHVLLIVGYGVKRFRRFWLLKNSYGREWGESGFMRFERGVGLCGIGSSSIWPLA